MIKRFSILDKDFCFHKTIPKTNPDKLELYYLTGRAEFSAGYELGFEKHLNRLIRFNHEEYFKNLKEDRLQQLTRCETLWY